MQAARVQRALDAGAIIGTWFWDLLADRFTIDASFPRGFGLDPARGRKYHRIEANGRVEGAADGTALHLPGVVLDISVRKADNEARLANEARPRLVVGGAKDHVILMTDKVGLVTSWSSGAEAILGWSADEIVGLSAIRPVHSGRPGRWRRRSGVAGGGERLRPRHALASAQDGHRAFMNVTLRPLPADETVGPGFA